MTVSDTTLAIELGDGDVKVVRRTTSKPPQHQGPATAEGGFSEP